MNNERTITRSQGRNREVGSEGRLWETCELMDKNRIEGRRGVVSWLNTAKPLGSRTEVNAAVVQGSIVFLPGEASTECVDRFQSTDKIDASHAAMYVVSAEESAEAIVVASESVSSRRRVNPSGEDYGKLWRSKGRTWVVGSTESDL